MMDKRNRIFIVWSEDRGGPEKYWQKMIGYLPGEQVPKGSILWSALLNSNELIRTEGGYGIAFRGIYEKKFLAIEHMKIEKEWRIENHFFITELKEENK